MCLLHVYFSRVSKSVVLARSFRRRMSVRRTITRLLLVTYPRTADYSPMPVIVSMNAKQVQQYAQRVVNDRSNTRRRLLTFPHFVFTWPSRISTHPVHFHLSFQSAVVTVLGCLSEVVHQSRMKRTRSSRCFPSFACDASPTCCFTAATPGGKTSASSASSRALPTSKTGWTSSVSADDKLLLIDSGHNERIVYNSAAVQHHHIHHQVRQCF